MNDKLCFFSSKRIRTLVAIATYSFHRLIMGKVEINNFFLSQLGYLDFLLQKWLLSSPLRFVRLLSKSMNSIGCQGTKRVNFRKKMLKNLLKNHKVDEADTLRACIILYITCVFFIPIG